MRNDWLSFWLAQEWTFNRRYKKEHKNSATRNLEDNWIWERKYSRKSQANSEIYNTIYLHGGQAYDYWSDYGSDYKSSFGATVHLYFSM
jgi:hypothetical protein